MNAPALSPSVLFELAVVGAVAVFQQTPLTVTASPLSFVIVPPDVAVVAVILLTAVVAPRVGGVTAEAGVKQFEGRKSATSPTNQLAVPYGAVVTKSICTMIIFFIRAKCILSIINIVIIIT